MAEPHSSASSEAVLSVATGLTGLPPVPPLPTSDDAANPRAPSWEPEARDGAVQEQQAFISARTPTGPNAVDACPMREPISLKRCAARDMGSQRAGTLPWGTQHPSRPFPRVQKTLQKMRSNKRTYVFACMNRSYHSEIHLSSGVVTEGFGDERSMLSAGGWSHGCLAR